MFETNLKRGNILVVLGLAAILAFGTEHYFGQQKMPAPNTQTPAAPMAKKPVERAKILTDTGVFGVYSIYKLRPEWTKLSAASRQGALAEVHKVLDTHERVLVDAYLSRGLSEKADYFLRFHAYDLEEAQQCIADFGNTTLGKNSEAVDTFVGVTKPLNYASKDSKLLATLRGTAYEGPAPKYAILIPTQKNAEWWNLSPEKRMETMVGHIEPTLVFLKSVKRKLYHSSGLDDLDFITYFETNDLSGFTDLTIALLSIPENLYNTRLGSPTVVGLIKSVDEVVKGLQ